MAAPDVAAVASANSTTNDVVVAVPAGTTNGDLLIAVNASDWSSFANNDVPAAFKTGTGGITLGTSDYDAGTDGFHMALGARIANSEPANYTFPVGPASGNVAAILRITGHDSTPVIAQVAPSTTGSGAQAPSIVPNGSDDLLLTFHGAETTSGGSRTWTPPTGMTEVVDRQEDIWTFLLVAKLQNPSNPSGIKTATPSSGIDNGVGCTISIKAAAAGGTNLVIQDATHAQVADNITIVQQHALTVQETRHIHTADGILLTQNHLLIVQKPVHAQTADNLTLSDIINLAVQKAIHAQNADNLNLPQIHNIAIHKAFLQTAADIVNFSGEEGEPVTVADVQVEKLQTLTASTGSISDLMHKYYGGLSGLAPVAAFSVSDHQRVYWETQTGLSGRSLADLERAFYDVQLVPSGSLADREYVYWSGL